MQAIIPTQMKVIELQKIQVRTNAASDENSESRDNRPPSLKNFDFKLKNFNFNFLGF